MGTDSSSFRKLKLHQKVKMKVLLCSFALVAVAVASDLSLNAQFAGFKHTHGKQYSNGIEEAYRKGVFASNIAKINQHNDEHARGEHTWTMSVNQFADLTHDEFMAMQTLKVKDLPKTTQKYQMKATADVTVDGMILLGNTSMEKVELRPRPIIHTLVETVHARLETMTLFPMLTDAMEDPTFTAQAMD